MQDQRRVSLGAASLRMLSFLILTALVAVILVVQQRGSGAYLAEFSATHPDEARHFVSGLAVADLLAAGAPNPGPFLSDYQIQFPAVALGAFPPLYHVAQGLWFSVLAPTTPAALLLPAFLCAFLVVSAGWVAARTAGVLPGVAVSAVLMAVPDLRTATVVIGLDLPLALLALAAALAYGVFLTSGLVTAAVGFALATAAAMLTAPAGLALILLPPFAAILGRRLDLFGSSAFWLPIPIVAALAGPWYLYGGAGSVGPLVDLGPAQMWAALETYGAALATGIGPLFLGLAGVGALFAVSRAWRREPEPEPEAMVAVTALALALLVFLILVPAPAEPGRALPLMAPVLILAAYGAMGLLGLVSQSWTTIWGLVVALVFLLVAMPALLAPVRKTAVGMDEAAQAVLARPVERPVVLVGADAKGEGALVAALAQRDRGRRSFVIRGADALASDMSAVPDPAAILARLDALAVAFLALDTAQASGERAATHGLKAAIAAFPERFQLIGTYPRGDGAGEARLYAVSGNTRLPVNPAEMKRRLGPALAPAPPPRS